MKIRIVAIFTVIIMALLLFVGCEGFSADGNSADETSAYDVIQNLKVNFNVIEGAKGTDSGEPDQSGVEPTTPSPSVPSPSAIKDAIKDIRHSVVDIEAVSASETVSLGSGVVIATATFENGDDEEHPAADAVYSYIVTCYHIVENAATVTITDADGRKYSAKPVGADSDTDLCVLSVPTFLKQATVYDAADTEVGEEVLTIGNPYGILNGTVKRGIISSKNRQINVNKTAIEVLQTDAVISGGNPGGGLFTTDGRLIGIINERYNSAYFNSVDGFSFAISSAIVKEISTQLMETYTGTQLGYIPGKYYLGCKVANSWSSSWMGQSKVIISQLDRTGSFYKAGLRVGDQIHSVVSEKGEALITTAVGFSEFIEFLNLQVGDVITVNVPRDERHIVPIQVEILQYICGAE